MPDNDWKDEKISWYATDLYELGYVKNQGDWENFQEILCDTVVAYLDMDGEQDARDD